MTIALGTRQNSRDQPQVQSQGAAHAGDSGAVHDFQPGKGGLEGHLVALGGGAEARQLLELAKEIAALLVEPQYSSPLDDPSLSSEEKIEIFNRDNMLHSQLKEAVAAKMHGASAESRLQSEIFQQLDRRIEVNSRAAFEDAGEIMQPAEGGEGKASTAGADRAPGLVRDSSNSEEFWQAANALRENSRGNPNDWLLMKSQVTLQDEKVACAKLEAQLQETRLSDEDRAPLQAKLELLRADIAKGELRLDDLNARIASSKISEARQKDAAALGNGDTRAATLSWAARAKQAFAAFFQPVLSGLGSMVRFVLELPTILHSNLSRRGREKAQLNDYLKDHIQKPLNPDDKKPASSTGNTQYICNGMAKDLPRVNVLIGGVKVDRKGESTESSEEKRSREAAQIEKAATALLQECGGDKDLCMRVSEFAFQVTESFWANAVKDGKLAPEGASAGEKFHAPDAATHSIEVTRLPEGGGVQLIFNAENPKLGFIPKVVTGGEFEYVEPLMLDPDKSAFNSRFSIVVGPDLSVAPYPLDPGSWDSSALSYEFYISPASDTN